jgi:peroxiredoxin
MKNRKQATRFAEALIWISVVSAVCHPPVIGAEIGSRVDSFQLPDILGTIRSSYQFSGKTIVLVFWAFKCPVSLAYNNRMEEFQKKYAGQEILIFGVASSVNETPAEIKANIDNLKISVPFLLDAEGNLAEKLEVTHTPEIFILDGAMNLRYKGAWDNNKMVQEKGRIAYVEDAVDAIIAGRAIGIPETKPVGCRIRRRGIGIQ